MPLIVRDTGGAEFQPLAAGVHIAICNMVCDCGVQPGGKFKPRHQVYVRWEIPGERVAWTDREGCAHEAPAQIGRFYTASLSGKAKLRNDLEAWRGRAFTAQELAGFDLLTILGAPCQLLIGNSAGADGKTYANIMGLMALPKGAPRPVAERALVRFSPDDRDQFNELPQWLQERVQQAQSADIATATLPADDDFDDDIPF